ncbi:MAG TPA: SMC family ATPase [Solirubrobacteraceae bacterium]|nr:SMC family ATPase [Solirubrobacteraceae bacterium]
MSVEIEGFGPFKDTERVDFTAFDDFGIFLITGRTGAGKSTILDAICFALYGSVPRYDNYTGATRLRSDHCSISDETKVALTFEVNGIEYRIARNPEYERPKARGEGTTKEAARVELAQRTGGDWKTLATKSGNVAEHIDEIVKLSAGQFRQVILLAQNRFQEFLEANSQDRQALLRSLFDTQRFEAYAQALQERARVLDTQVGALADEAERTVGELARVLEADVPMEDEGRIAWAEGGVAKANETVTTTKAAEAKATQDAETAQAALVAAQQLADRQGRRADAEGRLAELEQQTADHAVDLERSQAAERAAAVEIHLRATDDAKSVLEEAKSEEADARTAAATTGDVPGSGLEEIVDQIARTIGSLASALGVEAKLAGIEGAESTAREALTSHDATVAGIDRTRTELAERTAKLKADEAQASASAGDFAAAKEYLERTAAARGAAAEAKKVTAEVELLEAKLLEAVDDRTKASDEHGRLLKLQLDGKAAALAHALVDGEPCPVCGAHEHPNPAELMQEPVTDEQVEAAQKRVKAADTDVDNATGQRADLKAKAAERHGAAGGLDVATLDAELVEADARLKAADEARAQVEATAKGLSEIAKQQQELDAQERDATHKRSDLIRTLALAEKELADANTLLERSRDDHTSVAARSTHLEKRQSALERLIKAQSTLAVTTSTYEKAASMLANQLAEHGFTDRGAAEQALLAETDRNVLAKKLRAYEDSLTQTKALLDQPDLRDVPSEPADVTRATAQVSAAGDALKTCTENRGAAESAANHARMLAATLKGELAQHAERKSKLEVLEGLANATNGFEPNRFGIPLESFVLAAELEEIVDAANTHLRIMSQGRYTIEHSDERIRANARAGLGIVVYDAHTGRQRSPHSLSGGEKFLASLALALGLAEVVTNRAGGISLDTLFIDEGFGSLDSETLEVAMQSLDQLRHGGRTIGLISHVDAMKEQIPAKLLVETVGGGWSSIRQHA